MRKGTAEFRFDVVALSPVGRFVRWFGFPLTFQIVALGMVVALVVIGFEVWPKGPDPLAYAKTLRKTNLATLVVWGLWWPGMMVLTILLGRIWCTVCPMELVSQTTWRLGRRLGLARMPMPRWVRAGWIALLGYVILLLLVAGFALHRVPALTAWVLLALIGITVVVGLLFKEPRAFCRGFCPAAALLEAYGRLSPVNLINRSAEHCDTCHDKPCIDPKTRPGWDKRGCPSLARPFARQAGDGCVLCFQCVKACPYENVGFGWLRRGEALSTRAPLAFPVVVFVFMAFGFVAHEIFAEVKPLDNVFHIPAWWLSSLFGAAGLSKWAEAAWFLLGLPMLLAGAVLAIGKVAPRGTSVRTLMAGVAPALIPVVAMAHAAKAIGKASSWAPYLPMSLRDVNGVAAADALVAGQMAPPARLIPLELVGLLVIIVVVLAAGVILVRFRKAAMRVPIATAAIAMAVAVGLYLTSFLGWIGLIG